MHGKNVLAKVSAPRLLVLSAFYKLCGSERIVKPFATVLLASTQNGRGTAKDMLIASAQRILKTIVKYSVFNLFCGGQTIQECAKKVAQLKMQYSIKSIVDYSTEEKMSTTAWDENVSIKCRLIEQTTKMMTKDSVSFIPIKCTALLCPKLLEKMCSLTSNNIICSSEVIGLLSEDEKELFESGLNRLRKICRTAKLSNVPLLLDAEQSNRQPAIELIARILSAEFNRIKDASQGQGGRPIVYNTYQMYLHRTSHAIEYDLHISKQEGYIFAAKIVRGAYMYSERNTAQLLGYADPILPSKASADLAYNLAVRKLLGMIATNDTSAPVHIMLATHNKVSIEEAIRLMKEFAIRNADERVHFAQILGMADYCTHLLASEGYNVSKLVPFGPLDELLPWLLRRLDENKDMLGAMQAERHLYVDEFKRRLFK